MRVTVWRVDAALYRRDVLFCSWAEHAFQSAPRSIEERPTGYTLVRSTAASIEVSAPIGCRLEQEGDTPRLVTSFDRAGLDAGSVAHVATRGERGFALATPSAPAAARPAAVVPGRDWDEFSREVKAEQDAALEVYREVIGTALRAQPFMQAGDWGIAFESRLYPTRSFLAASSKGFGPVRSTNDLADVARWQHATQAVHWLHASGLDPARPLPIGVGFLHPVVARIPAAAAELRGIEFELTQRRPASAAPKERPARAGQAAFAFAD
jgi:hypothetical protein